MKKGEEDDNAIATTAASSLLALVNGLDNKSNKFNQLDEMQNHMSILITATNEKKTGKNNNKQDSEKNKTDSGEPAAGTEGGKRKSEGGDTQPRKKRETSDKSLAMGIFHVKKGTPVSKALPDKAKLKDGASICLDFCCHERKCKYPHALCKNGKHYTNWKNVPDDDKAVLLATVAAWWQQCGGCGGGGSATS